MSIDIIPRVSRITILSTNNWEIETKSMSHHWGVTSSAWNSSTVLAGTAYCLGQALLQENLVPLCLKIGDPHIQLTFKGGWANGESVFLLELGTHHIHFFLEPLIAASATTEFAAFSLCRSASACPIRPLQPWSTCPESLKVWANYSVGCGCSNFFPNPDLLFKKGFRNGHQFHQVFKTSFHPMISHHCSIKMAWTNLYYPLLSYIMLLWHSTACNYPFPHPFCRPSWHHTEIRPVPSNYATPVWPEMAIRIMLLLSGAYHISSCIHKNIQLYPQISPKWW